MKTVVPFDEKKTTHPDPKRTTLACDSSKDTLDKRVQHQDFPGGHPSQYYSGPSALNFGVLMGSGVLALV